MGEINHECTCHGNPLVPQVVKVIKITQETPDVKTFRMQTPDGKKPFAPLPGQLGMISVVGVGEGMFSITAQGEDWIGSVPRTCRGAGNRYPRTLRQSFSCGSAEGKRPDLYRRRYRPGSGALSDPLLYGTQGGLRTY